jgi:hypothetical protein
MKKHHAHGPPVPPPQCPPDPTREVWTVRHCRVQDFCSGVCATLDRKLRTQMSHLARGVGCGTGVHISASDFTHTHAMNNIPDKPAHYIACHRPCLSCLCAPRRAQFLRRDLWSPGLPGTPLPAWPGRGRPALPGSSRPARPGPARPRPPGLTELRPRPGGRAGPPGDRIY